MVEKHGWIRTVHRVDAAVALVAVATLVMLSLTGVVDGSMAFRLFLVIEVPLFLVFVVLTVARFRELRRAGCGRCRNALDQVVAEEPLLRPAVSELRYYRSLFLALAKKRVVPAEALSFSYTKGTMAIPTAIIAVSLVEIVIVHLIVPWQWLRVGLLVFSVWGILLVSGFFASRIVHPHLVTGESLILRWGLQTVLSTGHDNVVSVRKHVHHAYTQPAVEGERLILTQFQSANVSLHFAEPVVVDAPVPKKDRPVDSRITEVLLYVDDTEAFVEAVRRVSGGVSV